MDVAVVLGYVVFAVAASRDSVGGGRLGETGIRGEA